RKGSWWSRSTSCGAASPSSSIAPSCRLRKDSTAMCGIVGYVGHRDAVSFILPGLRRLEYRGYDSAGIATVSRTSLDVRKTTGRIADLEAVLTSDRPTGTLGVGHTGWATHGRPSEANAHPHLDCHARLAVVHNGIIENYRELRKSLAAEGHRFRSQTDTEVIAHLIERYQTNGLAAAVLRAARDLRGAFAIACIASAAPNTLVALRRGSSPLVIGYGRGEMFVASDIPALLGQTREVLVLDEGELAVLTPDGITLRTLDGAPLRRRPTTIPWDGEAAEKSGYPHFMLKEIFEQPEALRNTMRERLDLETPDIRIPELGLKDRDLAGLNRLCFVAREADGVVYTRAGLEIGVASTKAFTAQLVAVTLLALKLGLARNFADPALVRQVIKGLAELPDLLAVVLQRSDAIRRIAQRFVDSQHFLYLGRGLNYPLALEGALKLKEISYIHAEGYPAGEMKHGPIALIDSRMPVVAIAPRGATYEKMTSNIEEIKARDGIVIAIATEGDGEMAAKGDLVISVPPAPEWLQPLLIAVPPQLLAYHLGVLRCA